MSSFKNDMKSQNDRCSAGRNGRFFAAPKS